MKAFISYLKSALRILSNIKVLILIAVLLQHTLLNAQVNIAPQLGVENGWSNWVYRKGTFISPSNIAWTTTMTPTGPECSITSGTGIDPLTPGPNPGDPTLPVVLPGNGQHSFRLGTPGSKSGAEKMTFSFTVTPFDSNLTFSYASVFEGSDTVHPAGEESHATFRLLDPNGNPVPCTDIYLQGDSSYHIAAGTGGEIYRSWMTRGLNLAQYIGQTLTVEIINYDCAHGDHNGYTYWDFNKGVFDRLNCGSPDTICISYFSSQSYIQWFLNSGNQSIGTGTCIAHTPQHLDTLTAVIYEITGCYSALSFTYKDTCSQLWVAILSTPDPCGLSVGSVQATPLSGVPPYTYLWMPGGYTTAQVTGLLLGTYTVTVTDANSATAVLTTQVGGFQLTASYNVISPSCSNSSDGVAMLQQTNAAFPYQLIWCNGSTTYQAVGLSAGNCMVTLADGNGCTHTSILTITAPPPIQVQVNGAPPTCPACTDGWATASATAGTPPYKYFWLPGGQTTSMATGLAPGTYWVNVTDSKNCQQSASVQIPLGIDELLEGSLIIGPNPSDGFINLETGIGYKEDIILTLYDQTGRLVATDIWRSGIKWTWNLASLNAGIYMLRLRTDKGEVRRKILMR